MALSILMVLTSHGELGDTGKETGFWLEEFAAPYFVLRDAGLDITLASPAGGQPPVDPNSAAEDAQTAATRRFDTDVDAKTHLAQTKKLENVNPDDFDAVFYPGGHGPLWDLTDNPDSIALIERMWSKHKPIAAVCHAPAVLLRAKDDDGAPIVRGKEVTGFTNSEESAVGLSDVVPFMLEDELTNGGGRFAKVSDFAPHVKIDGMLITGQNPSSSGPAAEALLQLLGLLPL